MGGAGLTGLPAFPLKREVVEMGLRFPKRKALALTKSAGKGIFTGISKEISIFKREFKSNMKKSEQESLKRSVP